MVILELLTFMLLTLINALFVMSEMAMVSIRRSRLAPLAEDGDDRARRILDFSEQPTRFLSTVQIGITVTGLLAGASSGAKLSAHLAAFLTETTPALGTFADEIAFAVVIVAMTFVTLVLGELVPKRLAIAYPERISLALIDFVRVLTFLASPFVVLLSAASNIVLRILRIDDKGNSEVTEDEVKHVLAEGVVSGALDQDEREMLEGVMRVADRPVRAIMTPRPDLFWIDRNDPQEAILKEIAECPYSLVVVADGSIDEPVGVIFKKDVLSCALTGKVFDLDTTLKKPLVVPEGAPVLKLLATFRDNPIHCAFVVDEYGSLQGLVTLTDIIEGIAGDLADVDALSSGPVKREDGSWLFDGDTDIDDLERYFDLPELDRSGYHTLGGLILASLNRIPTEGDRALIGDFVFEVIDMDGRRIDKVMIFPRAGTSETESVA